MDNEPDAFETVCADMIPHLFCDSFKCRYTQACAGSLQFITDWPAPGECQHHWCSPAASICGNVIGTAELCLSCSARDASKCSPPLLTRPTIQQCPMHKDLGEDVLQHSLLKFITGQKL